MSMRSYQRQIAKARMAAIGVDRINRKMGGKFKFASGSIRRMMRTRCGRRLLGEIREDDQPNWKRVTTGDLAREAELALYPKKKPTRRIRRIKDAAQN